jgi:hypothetical protein
MSATSTAQAKDVGPRGALLCFSCRFSSYEEGYEGSVHDDTVVGLVEDVGTFVLDGHLMDNASGGRKRLSTVQMHPDYHKKSVTLPRVGYNLISRL